MGAEQSQQQRAPPDGKEIFEGPLSYTIAAAGASSSSAAAAAAAAAAAKRRNMLRQNTGSSASSTSRKNRQTYDATESPTTSEMSRPSSPPLSVCSDQPYVPYTDRPIGDSSPKIRNRALNSSAAARIAARKSSQTGAKPKRPQSTPASSHIVVVKPGAKDSDYEVDPDLARLKSIPQFLPVLRETVSSATFKRDPEILGRLQSQHFLNICNRMQAHLNICASAIASEQNHLVERTKILSNSITTIFASFVDMQKAYASYSEHFCRVRSISQQLSRCNSLLNENIASLESINDFLDVEDRLEPFVWRTDDNKLRSSEALELARRNQ